jgi:hypothetical protein
MMQRVPQIQDAPPWTGTFVREIGAVPSGSFGGLEDEDWVRFTITGSTVFVSAADGRPPLSWGGTGTVMATYSADVAANVWENITGCFCVFDALVRRDYCVLLTVDWMWASANWIYEYFSLRVNGSTTGVTRPDQMQPANWYRARDTNPPYTNEYDIRTMTFMLMDLPTGTYTVQAVHCPWGSAQDRSILRGYIAVA